MSAAQLPHPDFGCPDSPTGAHWLAAGPTPGEAVCQWCDLTFDLWQHIGELADEARP